MSRRFSKRSLEGELMIDHRASPGTRMVPGGTLFEERTVTCAHCQRTWIFNPLRTRPRNECKKCGRYVCDEPGCVALMTGPEVCELSVRFERARNAAEHNGGIVILV